MPPSTNTNNNTNQYKIMGWSSIHATEYKNGKVNRKAVIDKMWEDEKGRKILKSSMVGNVYYAAVLNEETKEVFALVYLTSTNAREWWNFSYKAMDETVGPFEDNCPAGILKLLTPTEYEYANNWRERCRKNLEKKTDKNSLGNLPLGSRISFIVDCDTTSFKKGDEVILTKMKKAQSNRYIWVEDNRCVYWTNHCIPENYKVV